MTRTADNQPHRLPLATGDGASRAAVDVIASVDEGDEALLQVGDLARLSGKTVRAIHLYEELGLLKPHARSKGRYRLYSHDALVRVRWIGKLQDSGFRSPSIQAVVREWETAPSAPGAMAKMREVYRQKLDETRAQIERLRRPSKPSSPKPAATSRPATRAIRCELLPACTCCDLHDTRPDRRPSSWRASARPDGSGRRPAMAIQLPIYMDYHATTPVDPRVLEAMLPVLQREVRQRGEPQPRLRLDGRRGRRLRARADRQAHRRREREGDRLHLGRDRVRQPRAQGRRRVLQGQGQPHHHQRDRAQGHPRHAASASRRRASAVTYLGVGKDGRVDPDDVRKRHHRQDDPRLDHARQQRGRHGAAPSPRSARSRASAACSSTPTRCRASARCRSTCRR